MHSVELDAIPPDLLEESPFNEQRPAISREEPFALKSVLAASDTGQTPFHSVGDGAEDSPVFGRSNFSPETSPHPFDGLCKKCLQAEPPRETKPALPARFTRKSTGWK